MWVASSMPVRDVETFAEPRADVRFVANRGVNGIDGFGSDKTLGVAGGVAGPDGRADRRPLVFSTTPTRCWASPDSELDAVFVVVDNDGGEIFSFLP